ncbi:hypothetical protein FT663_03089 [Candidozyma haemuli var. vulneris]|uniref:FHA domain-containing protein n=1 Tax=Candidozyma haemuli TaxID=45357 RepID=A0A2V1ASP4_9ASCO|nr:hypothetical protein CXQ85_000075 [[Candida] haemuloni]KAF3989336.1 hypothetical protein FT662_02887 [[Candida] haemuloni var. vulneris]KAF3990643.1 hypothetical protein FT663_03089 [[Candida] haemuloni var. vulneris]PVH21110.1 hypothetical protein CXQ85_000075 [[Candida] haemuloni]
MSTWQAHSDHTATSPRSTLPPTKSLDTDATPRMSHSPTPSAEFKSLVSNDLLRKNSNIVTSEAALSPSIEQSDAETSKISAYARLDFENYTFFVQTLQVVLGRKAVEDATPSHHAVDVHLSSKKAISRRHAKIFYNFGTQRFEISILGRNGAFVDDQFVETGITVPLVDNTKIQIGDIPFTFVLPSLEPLETGEKKSTPAKPFNPSDAINLRSNLYSNPASPNRKKSLTEEQKKARRDSRADIVRRLSTARRKSLASSTNDEISALLKELEDIGDEDENDSLDKEVNELLRQGNLDKEEDEIDELVKQHNLSQGIGIDDKDKKDVDVDMSVLDQEIASLAPLIDGQQSDKDVNAFDGKPGVYGRHGTTLHTADTADHRNGPLMGRAVGPRMGKPAQIQPPANRAYGRQPVGPMYGYTATGTYPTGYNPPYGATTGYAPGARNSMYHPMMMPTRPPPPKLEVEVQEITTVPVKPSVVPFKAISMGVGNIQRPPICVFKTLDPPSNKPKIPLRRKDAPSIKKPKSQGNKDVPEQYKSKPTVSVTAMISSVLRGPNPRKSGFTANEICEGIKEFYPYYQYCPDGWQSMVTHNLKTHKMFKREFKAGLESEHLWIIDEEFLAEKERVRKKQQEVAMAKAKEAALKAVELRSKQSTPQYGSVGRPFMTPYASSFGQPRYPTSRDSSPNGVAGQKPKSIAELASEIKRDSPGALTQPSYLQRSSLSPPSAGGTEQGNNIKNQLAANRSNSSSNVSNADVKTERGSPTPQPVAAAAAAVSATTTSGPVSKSLPMNADTKKSLAYLQKELFTLYKARKLSYNTATTTNIITKALATTIAQVNTIGAKAGCGDNALSFLVEKAPQQVSKILDIALTKSIKELEGKSSNPASKESTPVPATASPTPSAAGASQKSSINVEASNDKPASRPNTPSSPAGGTPKPSYSGGLSRPHFSGMARQQNLSKPGALSKGPSFLSNKPRQEKRPAEETGEDPSKSIKLE